MVDLVLYCKTLSKTMVVVGKGYETDGGSTSRVYTCVANPISFRMLSGFGGAWSLHVIMGGGRLYYVMLAQLVLCHIMS